VEVGEDGGCMAHVAELPGCCAVGPDETMVLAELPEQIARHRAWRATHGLPRIGEDGAPVVVRQTVHGPRPWRMDGASALFSVDRRLLTDQEFEGHLRVLACARADLLRAAHAIPRGAFDETAPGQARTVRDTLAHVADTEEWLISRLGRRVQVAEPDPLRRVVDVRARTLEHLTRYDRVDRDLIFVPTERMSEDPEEMWSLRKFLRRLIEHELQHMDDLAASAAHWSGGTGLE
jgi:uncharacterized damage-inducible protein DinB/predicted RNase H-like HicB family nuclease